MSVSDSGPSVGPATDDDLEHILTLNEGAVPHVNSIPLEELARLGGQAAFFGVARSPDSQQIDGFLLALNQAAEYDSLNFRWHQRQFDTFVYIDRIVVTPASRRSGVGRALYQALIRAVEDLTPRLTCEVNVKPPNPRSIAFHQSLGFREVGQQDTEGGNKRVSLMALELTPGSAQSTTSRR